MDSVRRQEQWQQRTALGIGLGTKFWAGDFTKSMRLLVGSRQPSVYRAISKKLAGKRLRKESHVPRPITVSHGPLRTGPYTRLLLAYGGLPIVYGTRTYTRTYTRPYGGYSANFLIYMYCGGRQEGRELMTEKCTVCEAVLRIAGMPSYGLETIRVCNGCGKLYTGEMLEWNVVDRPSATESSTVPVNQRQSARRGMTTHKYAACKYLRQVDNHLS